MSGGSLEYNQFAFEDVAESIDKYLLKHGDDLPEEVKARFAFAAKAARRVGDMIHEVDYRICDDTGDDSFVKRWKEKFETLDAKDKLTIYSKDEKTASRELIDGAYDLVEMHFPTGEYSKKWRLNWLAKARELGASADWGG